MIGLWKFAFCLLLLGMSQHVMAAPGEKATKPPKQTTEKLPKQTTEKPSHKTPARPIQGTKETKRFWLRGWVLEKGRREPVEGASVFIKSLRLYTYTDAKGQYRLQVPAGKYLLGARAVGFLTNKEKVEIKGPTTQSLYVEVDPANTLQSTVRAKRSKQSSQQFSADRELLKTAPGLLGGDPFRFFQNLPGVARAARTSGAIVVRGASLADTGFYIDGHRIPYLYHFGAGLTVVSRRFMEKIDFFPGGAPLQFGRLTAGLLSAHSRIPNATTVHGEAYISIANAGFYLEVPIGKHWTIAAAASRSYIDAFYSLITKDPLVGAFWDYQLKVSYQSKQHMFSLFFFGSDDYYDYAGKDAGPEVPLIGRQKVTRALRFLRMIAKYHYITKTFSLRTSLATGFDQDQTQTIERKDDQLNVPIELRVDAQWKLHKRLRLDLGLDGLWQHQGIDYRAPADDAGGFPRPAPGAFVQNIQTNQQLLAPALYLSMRWQPWDPLVLQLGVRGDLTVFQGRVRPGIDPRLSATLSLHRYWRLLLSTGLYHRPPLSQEWSAERGNPDLQLPSAYQLATGLSFAYQKHIQIKAQFFYTQMFQLVVPSEALVTRDGTLSPERYNNEGIGRALGMEMLVRFQVARRLFGWVAYTLSRAERGREGGAMSLFEFDQTHILNLMLRWRIGAGWSMSARFRMASGNPTPTVERVVYDADTDNYRPIFRTSQTERLPLFHQLDLRVDKVWTFNNWKLGFYLDILNVYNAKVAEEYRFTYNFKSREPVSGLPFFPALGLRGEF